MTGKTLSYYATLNGSMELTDEAIRGLVAKRHGIMFPSVNPFVAKINEIKKQLAVDRLSAKKTEQLTAQLNRFTRKSESWANGKEKKIAALSARLDNLVTSEIVKAGRLFKAGKLKDVPQAQPPKVNIGVVRPQYKKTDKKKLQPAISKPGTTGAGVAKPKLPSGGGMLGTIG